jgi:hypothetical protein
VKLIRFQPYCITAEVRFMHVSRELNSVSLLSDTFTVHNYDHQGNKMRVLSMESNYFGTERAKTQLLIYSTPSTGSKVHIYFF